jgi:exopolysaccharide production protein ExoZ
MTVPPEDEGPARLSAGSSSVENSALGVPTEFTPRRLTAIQSLRAIAALMVVFHHVQDQSPGFKAVWDTQVGQAGVDLFFVISGFVMVYVTGERERSPRQFIAMRAARIIPVYWFYTACAVVLMVAAPWLYRSGELSVRHVVLSLLFIPHETAHAGLSPVIRLGWTLNYEMFFYVIFAIAMAISARYRLWLAAGFLSLLTATGYAMNFVGFSIGAADFYFRSIILEFAFGMIIASMFLRGKFQSIGHRWGTALIIGGFLALIALDRFYSDSTRAVVYGLPSSCIMIGALIAGNRTRILNSNLLQKIGDASYSIYLVHPFGIAIIRSLWKKTALPMESIPSFALFILLAFALAIVLGTISYRLIEKPSLAFLRKRIARLA